MDSRKEIPQILTAQLFLGHPLYLLARHDIANGTFSFMPGRLIPLKGKERVSYDDFQSHFLNKVEH